MSQYKNLFNSTRVPHFDVDQLETYPDSRHIVVISRGKFYTFDTFDDKVRFPRVTSSGSVLQQTKSSTPIVPT